MNGRTAKEVCRFSSPHENFLEKKRKTPSEKGNLPSIPPKIPIPLSLPQWLW